MKPPKALLVRRDTFLASTIIVLAALVAYYNSFSGPLIFDDRVALMANPSIRHWRSALFPPYDSTVGGRPLLNFTFAINYASSGMNVWGYHAFNLLVHLLAGLTLFGIVRRTLMSPALEKRFGTVALPLALAIAAIWVVHPLQTEAVTYITQRAESLMGLFYLLTLYCFILSLESAAPVKWQVLSVVAGLLGMMSKETMVTTPLIVFLYDRIFISGSFREAWRRRWPYYIGLACMWLLLLARLRLGLHHQGVGFDQGVTWWRYALTSCRSVVFYLKLAIWPHPLVLDYGNDIVTNATRVLPYVTVLVALVVSVLIMLWRWPTIGFAGAWFFIILAPTSSIIPLVGQPMAEHRMYLPLAAIIALAVLGLHILIRWRGLVVLAVAVVVLTWLSIRRNNDYRSELAIWSDTVAKLPENARARSYLGNVLLEIPGRMPDAIAEYQEALRIKPNYAGAHCNYGNALLKIPGRVRDAISEYQEALRINPDLAEAHFDLGRALLTIPGRMRDAIAEFKKALQIKPDLAEAHFNLGNALLKDPTRRSDAVTEFKEALRINPDYAEAHYNLGIVLAPMPGQLADAITHFEAALRINPNYAQTHYDLGIVLAKIPGRLPDAISHYESALRINPSYTEAHNNLGTLLAQMPGRLPDAITHFEAALRINPNSAETHYDLGVVLAKIPGRLPDAISHYEAALRINPDYAEAHYGLGIVLAKTPGRMSDAISHYDAALRVNPSYAEAHDKLGIALAQMSGRVPEAIIHFKTALRLKPDFAEARENLILIDQWQAHQPRQP